MTDKTKSDQIFDADVARGGPIRRPAVTDII